MVKKKLMLMVYNYYIYIDLHKKVNKLSSQVKEIVNKGSNSSAPPKKQDKNIMDKPMSMTEKNALGANIRNLNPDQLKGIISILSDSNTVEQNLRYFEFDIENLPIRKLRELEKYVRNCISETNKFKKNKVLTEKEKIAQLRVKNKISKINL